MGSWTQAFTNASTFLGAGGSPFGRLGGGPINPGVAKTQALPNQNGRLGMNYSCGGGCGCGCDTPTPSGGADQGVNNAFLCLNWLAFTS
jgi:hypothetical protein